MLGANREYIEAVVPHLAELMVDNPHEVLDCETVVVGNAAPEFAELLAGTKATSVVDLVGLSLTDAQRQALGDRYVGIAW